MAEEQDSKTLKIRINVAGFEGGPCSLYCVLDTDTEMLLVGRKGGYDGTRRDGFMCVTMQGGDAAHDLVFDQDNFRDAIRAFFEMRDLRLMQFGSGLDGINPEHRIERAGMDEHGIVYRLGPDITSPMVAVIIAAHVAHQQRANIMAQDMADDMLILDGSYDKDVDEMYRHWD